MENLIIALILIMSALSACISYYFTSRVYFRKGLEQTQNKTEVLEGTAIGYKALQGYEQKNIMTGYNSLMNNKTGMENVALKIGFDPKPLFTFDEVLNKHVRYKDGAECMIVGGTEFALLGQSLDGKSIFGFGRLENIVEIIN